MRFRAMDVVERFSRTVVGRKDWSNEGEPKVLRGRNCWMNWRDWAMEGPISDAGIAAVSGDYEQAPIHDQSHCQRQAVKLPLSGRMTHDFRKGGCYF